MEWHIITGEYPPKHGGVSDYTYRLAQALGEAEEDVHIWTSAGPASAPALERVEVHHLPPKYGLRWLGALHGAITAADDQATVLVQYVPHMYGWKAMNVAFCLWLALQCNKKKIWVMFHEIAFPFKKGQPLKHNFLALVHRIMAWILVRSAKRSFTSIEAYQSMLVQLASRKQIELLRLFSNVPFQPAVEVEDHRRVRARPRVGIFSSFGREICVLLEDVLPVLLKDSTFELLLVGPGARFIRRFAKAYPMFDGRLSTSGRVGAFEAGAYIQSCDVLLQLYPDGACGARGSFLAALASGLPVITTAGELTEPLLLESGAVAFADTSPRAIRRVLEELLADKAAAGNLGAAGRRLYESHFDLPVAISILSEGRLPSPTSCRVARFA
jgi:glycosyltransferase involved in cell wall biosynthesis